MKRIRLGRLSATVAAITLLAVTTAASPGAAMEGAHCIIVVEETSDGVLDARGAPECFATYTEVLDDLAAVSHGGMTRWNRAIGTHFTGASYTGSSVTITGTTCSGGVWYPTGSWNNNIASSYHYCGSAPTRFYDSSTCSGTSRVIYAAASTLGTMNNRASCVRYG